MFNALLLKTNRSMILIAMMFLSLPNQAEAALPGDLNGDGSVSISEVQTTINAFLGLIPSDTIAPLAPANLAATANSGSSIGLSWSASTDNVSVAGYKVFRNSVLLTKVPSNGFSDSGLSAASSYSYTVLAFDAAGNDSAPSLPATATTLAGTSAVPSLVGTWYAPLPNDGPVVITFLDGANYMLTHDGIEDQFGKPGIEIGTYAFNPTSKEFSAQVSVDTNGQWGLSHATFTLSTDGSSLIENGTAFAIRASRSASNALIGSWYVPYPDGGQAKGPILITFIDGSNFMMAHDGDIVADPSGQPGMERGTYTWNQSTGAFTANIIADTNGEWGFSDSGPLVFRVSADGNSLSVNDGVFAGRVQ